MSQVAEEQGLCTPTRPRLAARVPPNFSLWFSRYFPFGSSNSLAVKYNQFVNGHVFKTPPGVLNQLLLL